MRMWMVPPEELCDKHLLGEHVECHMFFGAIKKGKSVRGYLEGGLLEPYWLKQRHEVLAKEMRRRGMKHKSPMRFPKGFKPPGNQLVQYVDPERNRFELIHLCEECRRRMKP